MTKYILKPLLVSVTFLIGFFLLEHHFIHRLKQNNKKIYSVLIEISYFILFWLMIYARFL